MVTKAAPDRVRDEPSYVLHHYDWSESSLIAEVWSRHHGRVAVVAKGAKKPASQFRSILLPLQALQMAWSGDAEIRTLKAAQWAGGAVMPRGDALLAGLYLNEVVLRTLPRDDPHPDLFDVYDFAVRHLQDESRRLGVLRAFELMWLQGLGVLPQLDLNGTTHQRLDDQRLYRLQAEMGLQPTEAQSLPGAAWQALAAQLKTAIMQDDLVDLCQQHESTLRVQLRALLQYHSGLSSFRTRQLWLDVAAVGQRARAVAATATET